MPFDHGIKELLDRRVVSDVGHMRLNQSGALSELPGPLKRFHFSTGDDDGPASGAQRQTNSLADPAAASSDYRGSHVVCHKWCSSVGLIGTAHDRALA